MTCQIRRAKLDDVGRLALVGAATFLDTFAGILDGAAIVAHCHTEHSSDTYDRYLQTGAAAWLAETTDGAAPVGFALVTSSSLPGSNPEGGDLELKRIYSLSRFHGCGVGAALLAAAVEFATGEHAARLLLGVYVGNERAQAFYRKNGFLPIAERRFRVGDKDYDDIVFVKDLASLRRPDPDPAHQW
jgi:ribosomal protein S18 acetylase RimI-like enzyme